eukprot:129796-Rhodomonas_salina.1
MATQSTAGDGGGSGAPLAPSTIASPSQFWPAPLECLKARTSFGCAPAIPLPVRASRASSPRVGGALPT